MSDQPEETFVMRIVAEGDQTLTEIEKLSQAIERFTTMIRDLNQETQKSFSEIGISAKRVQKDLLKSNLQNLERIDPERFMTDQPGLRADVIKEAQRNIDAITQSVKNLTDEKKKSATTDEQWAGSAAKAAKAQQQGFDASIKKTDEYRQHIEAIKTEMQKAAQAGKSLTDFGKGLVESGRATTTNVTTALNEMKAAEQAAAAEAQKHYALSGQAAVDYAKRIDDIKRKIQEIAKTTGVSFKAAAESLKGTFNVSEVNEGLKQLTATTGGTTQAFGGLGNVAQFVFGSVLGLSAVNVLRNIVKYLQDAAQAGVEFGKAIYQMGIGVRALQRQGTEITLKDVYDQIETLRSSFKVFTTKDLVVGSAAFLNLIRDLGFTKEQIIELQNSIATLAIVNGRSMDEVQKTVALALSSGYTEGLQRLGVSINRVTIAEKAAELGWNKGYTALTEQQRAYATYLLVLEKTLAYQDDLKQYYSTVPGQIEATTAALEEEKNALGLSLQPLTLIIEKLKLIGIESLRTFGIFAVLRSIGNSIILIADAFRIWGEEVEALKRIATDSIKGFIEFENNVRKLLLTLLEKFNLDDTFLGKILELFLRIPEAVSAAFSALNRFRSAISGMVTDLANANPKLKEYLEDVKELKETGRIDLSVDLESNGEINADELTGGLSKEETVNAARELNEAIEEEVQEGNERRRDLWLDYFRDIERMHRQAASNIADAARDLAQKLTDIDRKFAQDVADENQDYADKLADEAADTANRRAEIEADYRNKEIDAEARFQEKLRKLREDFLFSLEDALRERDARQVIRLIRQYNKDREQAKRDYELDKQERARAFQQELQDLARQSAQRRAEIARDHQRRLAELSRQHAQEREEAIRAYQQKIEDEKRKLEEQKRERAIKLQEQLADLSIHLQDRINKVAEKLVEEYDVTEVGLKQIYDLYNAYYGPNGYVEGVYLYLMQMWEQAAAMAALVPTLPQSAPGTSTRNPGASQWDQVDHNRAHGGFDILTKPTKFLAGEAGPEAVWSVPLGRNGVNVNKTSGTLPAGMKLPGGGSSRIEVDVSLSPDLVATVVDKSLDATADMLFQVQRKNS